MNTILVILIILLALRLLFQWLVPLVFPYLLKRLIKKQGGPFDPMNRSADATANEKNSIKKPQNPSKGDDDEYIDFEEIQ